ncbi:MAG: PEGA domain-containing protein [Nitrospirota bacterium]|nr:PEGA domain-containing protein [Nitrospirota bacterium]
MRMTAADTLAGLALAALLLSGCATPPPAALSGYAGTEGGIQFLSVPADAEVAVDGEPRGRVADYSGPNVLWMERGLHVVEVRRDGFYTFFRQVEITGGLVEVFVFTMRESREVETRADKAGRR